MAFVVSVVLVGVLLVEFFPTRTFLAQRADTRKADQQLEVLNASNAALERKIHRLQTPDQVEQIARQDYGLVRPGEEAYAILPTPPPPVKLPNVWPFTGVAAALNS